MSPSHSEHPPAKRQKRPRALRACDLCRLKKNKCDEAYPCSYCLKHFAECVYATGDSSKKLPRGAQEIEALERRLTQLKSRLPQDHTAYPDGRPETASFHSVTNLEPLGLGEQPPPAYSQNHPETQSPLREVVEDHTDTNEHTNSIEYYGSSSSVAFLRRVQTECDGRNKTQESGKCKLSLVSMLHNTAFSPLSPAEPHPQVNRALDQDRFYFRVSAKFIEGYFENIHYIQPILDRDEFTTRCEDLWFGEPQKQGASFHALYYSILSLGALVRVWNGEPLCGLDRFEWSRLLFTEARMAIDRLGATTDLEMVQCLFIVAKICQHELNPHMTYLYAGQAVRTALAIGLNRHPSSRSREDASYSRAAWKTWWGLYALDSQTSLALGRPDSLGPDEYHTRQFPCSSNEDSLGDAIGTPNIPELRIVPIMVNFSRIIRRICLKVYASTFSLHEKLLEAKQISSELDDWFNGLPEHLHPLQDKVPAKSLKSVRRGSKYLIKQRQVILIRYYNARMIIHGPFITANASTELLSNSLFQESVQKCLDSATKTIEAIHEIYCNDDYFQTWWYNSTYILFAVTMILIYIFKVASEAQEPLFHSIEQAIELLEEMDECVVTKNAIAIIKRNLVRVKKYSESLKEGSQQNTEAPMTPNIPDLNFTQVVDVFPEGMEVGETNGDQFLDLDGQQFDNGQLLFGTQWGNSLSLLGTSWSARDI